MNLFILASTILLAIAIAIAIKTSDSDAEKKKADFFEREHKANFVRKKPLDKLNYITIPEDILSYNYAKTLSGSDKKEAGLTASARVRAERRAAELKAKGEVAILDKIEKDIIDRDYADMHREVSPLKKADDAIEIDSSNMTIEEVQDAILALCK